MRGKWMFGIGLCLIALALIFLYLIFPMLTKMPADYEEEYSFEGSVQVFVEAYGSLVPIETKMTRMLEATDVTDEDVVLIKQDITFFEKTSGAPLSAINPALAALDSSEVYGVDRTTRANVPAEGDISRTGQFTFPADVQQETYSFWSSSTGTALPANFVGEETFQGLKVYKFQISFTSQAMDVSTEIKVEPLAGIPVYTNTTTTVKTQIAPDQWISTLINNSAFTQETIDEMVETAKSSANLITWVSIYGFWGVIVIGGFLVIFGLLKFRS